MMKTTSPKVLFSNKIVFWFLCLTTAMLLFMESFGPQSIIPSNIYISDQLSAPEIYFDFDIDSSNTNLGNSLANTTIIENMPVNPLIEKYSINLFSENRPGKDKVDMRYAKGMENFNPVPYNKTKMKYIMVWNNAYDEFSEGVDNSHDPEMLLKGGCPEPNCMLVSNKSMMSHDEFDAIIIHYRATDRQTRLPNRRSEHQRWIFKATEPASYAHLSPDMFDNRVNWTMTYRLDSDIPIPYGIMRRKSDEEKAKETMADIIKPLEKTKMAAWFVSNCRSHSLRENVVKVMQSMIEVDVYGKCGQLKCGRDRTSECYEKLEKEYKFYLSFENSLCNDYVTEKLFSVLNYQVIPIVFGSAEYMSIAPPHSFISVLDYPSIGKLVEYMKYLATNETAYNEYFVWKKDYKNMPQIRIAFICHICYKLHHDNSKKVYTDMTSWFLKESECKRIKKKSYNLSSLKNQAQKYLSQYFNN